jgi:hypothetical protein
MLLLLSEFSPSDLGLDVGHALQLSKILSNFIKRNVPRSFSASTSFLGRDLIISVFVSSRMDGLNLSSILNLPSVLDCLPPYVRKFWSPPLVAWKYVKTSGQEFFSYGVLGRSVRASQVNKIIHSGCACSRFPSFVDSHHGHVIFANLNILSRPSLIELFLEALSSEVASCLCCLLKKLLLKVFTSLSTSKRASRSSRDMK